MAQCANTVLLERVFTVIRVRNATFYHSMNDARSVNKKPFGRDIIVSKFREYAGQTCCFVGADRILSCEKTAHIYQDYIYLKDFLPLAHR